ALAAAGSRRPQLALHRGHDVRRARRRRAGRPGRGRESLCARAARYRRLRGQRLRGRVARMKNIYIALGLLVLAATPAVHAQDGTAYYGLSIGELDYNDSDVFSDSVSTWHLMVGYQFLEHLSVEGAYGQSSSIRDTAIFPGIFPGQQDELSYSTELDHILTIRLLGVLPFEDAGISLMAGVGYADIDQQIDVGLNGAPLASGDV